MGSVFLVYRMPLVGMVIHPILCVQRDSRCHLLPEFSEILAVILGIPGVIIDITAVKMAKKKISLLAQYMVSCSR